MGSLVELQKRLQDMHLTRINGNFTPLEGGLTRTAVLTALVVAAGACEAPGPDVVPPTQMPGDLPAEVAALAGGEDRPVVGDIVEVEGEIRAVSVDRGGHTIYLSASPVSDGTPRILRSDWDDEAERFADPTPVHFSDGVFPDEDPFLVPDGSYLLFGSLRPAGQPGLEGSNVWVAQWRANEGAGADWSDPWPVPLVNSAAWDGAPSLASSGNLYFSTHREGLDAGRQLYRSELDDGAWLAPEPLGDPVASVDDDTDPWVAPDESFLLFASNREGPYNLYVSFRSDVGGWLDPLPLGDPVNTDADETTPVLSASGEFLFFHREGEGMRWISVSESGLDGVMAGAGASR
jgi:hypothetical protein